MISVLNDISSSLVKLTFYLLVRKIFELLDILDF